MLSYNMILLYEPRSIEIHLTLFICPEIFLVAEALNWSIDRNAVVIFS